MEAIYEINLKIAPLQLNKSQYLSRIEGSPPKRKPRHSPKEKMKNNFQFESILKNAKGDNKAFPKLGNVLMLPNQKNL